MRLNVKGMTCSHCERSVKQVVAALGGSAEVDLTNGTVDVEGIDDADALRRAIESEGFNVVDSASSSPKSGCCPER